jgi:hypothetical protein
MCGQIIHMRERTNPPSPLPLFPSLPLSFFNYLNYINMEGTSPTPPFVHSLESLHLLLLILCTSFSSYPSIYLLCIVRICSESFPPGQVPSHLSHTILLRITLSTKWSTLYSVHVVQIAPQSTTSFPSRMRMSSRHEVIQRHEGTLVKTQSW